MVKSVQPNTQSLHKTSSHLSQDSQLNNSFTLAVLLGAAVSHLERGIAASWHYRTLGGTAALNKPLGGMGYLYVSLSSITSFSSSLTVQTDENQQVLISSLLHWCPSSSQAFPLTSPSILEKKGAKSDLRAAPLIPKA